MHALQIEIARGLYMNEARIERAPGFADFVAEMTNLVARLCAADWTFLRT